MEGAQERTGDAVVVEYMDRKDVVSLWAVLCALEGRLKSKEELAMIRPEVVTRVESRHKAGTLEERLAPKEVSRQKYIQRTTQGGRIGGPPEVEAWAAEGGYRIAVYREPKRGEGYRKLVEYGGGYPLHAGILWTKQRVYTVLLGVTGPLNDADEVVAAVQRVLVSAQEAHEWTDEMPDSARQQVILADVKCLYWAVSAVEGKGGQAAADEVRRAITEGDMVQLLGSGWAPPDLARRRIVDLGAIPQQSAHGGDMGRGV